MGCGAIMTTEFPQHSQAICSAESPNCSSSTWAISARAVNFLRVIEEAYWFGNSLGALVFRSGASLAATLDEGSLERTPFQVARVGKTILDPQRETEFKPMCCSKRCFLRSSGNNARKRNWY